MRAAKSDHSSCQGMHKKNYFRELQAAVRFGVLQERPSKQTDPCRGIDLAISRGRTNNDKAPPEFGDSRDIAGNHGNIQPRASTPKAH